MSTPVDRFPTDPAAPPREVPADAPRATVHALPSGEDPLIAETRAILMGLSAMGYVGVAVIGVLPRGEGFSVAGSSHIDGLRMLGMLDVAMSQVRTQMHRGPVKSPPGAMPPKGAP